MSNLQIAETFAQTTATFVCLCNELQIKNIYVEPFDINNKTFITWITLNTQRIFLKQLEEFAKYFNDDDILVRHEEDKEGNNLILLCIQFIVK